MRRDCLVLACLIVLALGVVASMIVSHVKPPSRLTSNATSEVTRADDQRRIWATPSCHDSPPFGSSIWSLGVNEVTANAPSLVSETIGKSIDRTLIRQSCF